MYKKVGAESEILTPELARAMATMTPVVGERPLKPSRVAFLRNHVDMGTFVGPSWATATDTNTGTAYRLNGQHSSRMLADLPAELFPVGLVVTIEKYEYSDAYTDLPALFNCFDHPRSARSDEDYMATQRARYTDLMDADVSPRFLVSVTNGIAFASCGSGQERAYSHRDRGAYLEDEHHRQFAIWLWQFRDSLHGSFVGKVGVVAEIFGDWQHNQPLAMEFWSEVFTETNPDVESDSRELIRAIQDLAASVQNVKQMTYQKKAHRSWGRFRKIREAGSAAKAA